MMGGGGGFLGGFSCKWEMTEMPRCQDGAAALCHLSATRRRGDLSGSFPGRCCACYRASHPRPAAVGLLKYPRSRSPEVALAFHQSPGTHPSEGPAAPSPCSLPARMSALGFPRSAGASSGLPGRLGARREARRQPGHAGESGRLCCFLSGSWVRASNPATSRGCVGAAKNAVSVPQGLRQCGEHPSEGARSRLCHGVGICWW